MSLKAFFPRVSRRVIIAAALVWLALTAIVALLEGERSFALAFLKGLCATAASVAFAVAGGGAVLSSARQLEATLRAGPIVRDMIRDVKADLGELAATTLELVRPAWRGFDRVSARVAGNLVSVPACESADQLLRDIGAVIYDLGSERYGNAEYFEAAPLEPPSADVQSTLLKQALDQRSKIATLAERVSTSALEIVDYDDSRGSEVATAAIRLKVRVRRWERRLACEDFPPSWQDVVTGCSLIWGACRELGAALKLAHEDNYNATWWGQRGIYREIDALRESPELDQGAAELNKMSIESALRFSKL